MSTTLNTYSELNADILVIGGGGAALRAALEANEGGLDVLIVSKGEVGKSGATYFSVAEVGAFNVPDGNIDPNDNPDVFYNDIMNAALGTADPKLVRILADEAVDAKKYLKENGMEFAKKEDGSYMGYRACFSSKARSYVVQNHFKPIVKVLSSLIKKRNIRCVEGLTITNLLISDNTCCGAFALNNKNDRYIIHAKSVIIATGGASTLFFRNMYPNDITGDGYAMAYRAGAKIANMEFIQAGIGLAYPVVNLFGNQLWEAMPNLTNGNGKPFLKKYIDGPYTEKDVITSKGGHFPFSTRDISRYIEIAVQREISEGVSTKNGNVFLDFLSTDFEGLFANKNSTFVDMWPLTYNRFKEFGVDLYHENIEIACFAHAINGGVIIDENGQTTIEGLFAAGETAAGPHGADRLGGNMSVTCQVFGRRAGRTAAERALKIKSSLKPIKPEEKENEFLGQFGAKSPDEIDEMLNLLKKSADSSLLIVRNEERLNSFSNIIEELEVSLHKSGRQIERASITQLVELQNLLDTAKLVVKAALLRKESRGSHYRSDFTDLDCSMAKRNCL
jgi:fumarate reductase (CoM/CoB) subunit A